MAKRTESGEYVSAHVSQADRVYNQLMQSGNPVQSYRQSGDIITFRTAQPAPTHRRRSRWWLWIVGAVVAFFVVAAMLKVGLLAASTGTALAGVILFGALFLFVWKLSAHRGFIWTMVGVMVAAVFMIGAMTSAETTYNPEAAMKIQAIADECGGVGNGDIQCRWDSLVESTQKLAEVAQSPASEGLGTAVLVFLVLLFGGGWVYWRIAVIGKNR